MDKQKKVVIIDAKNILWRTVTGAVKVPVIIPETAEDVSGGHAMLKVITKVIQDWEPELILASWDTGLPEKKIDALPTYKENRDRNFEGGNYHQNKDRVEALVRRAKDTLEEMGVINIFPEENAEGDDLIGSMMLDENFLKGYKKIILSSDKDFLHLADKATISLIRKFNILINKDNFEKHFKQVFKIKSEFNSFPIEAFILYQAVVGDQVDNIPGTCSGVGSQAIYNLVNLLLNNKFIKPEEFRDFDKVMEAFQKLYDFLSERKYKTKINVILMSKIALKFNWDFFDPKTWDREYSGEIIRNYDFKCPQEYSDEKFYNHCKKIRILTPKLYKYTIRKQIGRTIENFKDLIYET